MAEQPKTGSLTVDENSVARFTGERNLAGGLVGEFNAVQRKLVEQSELSNRLQKRLTQLEQKHEKALTQLAEREKSLVQLEAERNALAERQEELSRDLIQKEVEVQKDREKLRRQFADREASLRREMEGHQAALQERENTYRSQSQELMARAASLEEEHAKLQRELKMRAVEHETAIADLVRQREQFQADFQSRMEAKAAEYVDTALASLKTSEERFDRIGSWWAFGGLIGVIGGLVLAFILATEATATVVGNKDISWSLILFFGVKGAVLLGLVVGMIRLCMRLARNYMHESLKSAERRHAINYGKFYLSVYGAGTDGEKLKDVFANWNTSGTSAFSEKDEPFPQPSLSEVSELAKAIVGLKKGAKDDDKD